MKKNKNPWRNITGTPEDPWYEPKGEEVHPNLHRHPIEVAEAEAFQVSGHQTRTIVEHYNIVNAKEPK